MSLASCNARLCVSFSCLLFLSIFSQSSSASTSKLFSWPFTEAYQSFSLALFTIVRKTNKKGKFYIEISSHRLNFLTPTSENTQRTQIILSLLPQFRNFLPYPDENNQDVKKRGGNHKIFKAFYSSLKQCVIFRFSLRTHKTHS